ncbi:MAG: penicillin-binding protein 2 [Patescibacteria group bacterium]
MFKPFEIDNLKVKEKELRLNGFSKRQWEGEVFSPDQVRGEIIIPPINPAKLKKINLLIFILILLFFGRVFYLQVVRGDYYYYIAKGRHSRIETLKASRGIFYDRNNKPLVKNIPVFSLNVIPALLPKKEEEYLALTEKIRQFLPSERRNEFSENLKDIPKFAFESIPVLRSLDYQTAILLKIKSAKINGFEVVLDSQRFCEEPFAFSHLLGYLGKISQKELQQNKNYLFNDLIGKSGLEFVYESHLRGQNGQRRIEVGSAGEEEIFYSKPAIAGDNLYLTIDADLQKKLFETLSYYTRQFRGKAGAAVALNPNNGEVLAIVSSPSYDNNAFNKGLSLEEFNKIINNPGQPLIFRAISGEYPSGSIIKPILAAAALAEGIITPQTTIFSSGGISVGQWFFADWKAGGHGSTNVVKALAESVNTFFYYIGGGYKNFSGLGIEKMNQWFNLFGLGSLTGIDLPNEKSGFLPTPEWKKEAKNEIWYPGDTYHLSIGQGDLLVTPLQVANFTAAIANGGILYQPHLIKEISNSETGEKNQIQPKILRTDFIKEENLKPVKEGMRAAVVWGSARGLAGLPVKVAGKTGTAQNPFGPPHAWFTCFAPYEKPEIVLTILIENGGEGGVAALPAARDVLNWWFTKKK